MMSWEQSTQRENGKTDINTFLSLKFTGWGLMKREGRGLATEQVSILSL